MKRMVVGMMVVALAFLTGGCCSICPCKSGKNAALSKGVIRHVVLFKWKDGTPAETIRNIENNGRALKSRIPVIASFEWGTDISPEKLAQGFTHCFFVTFRNEADRDAYLPHQAHKEFIELIKPHLDKVLVVDYVARD
jgi:hypothetical protein